MSQDSIKSEPSTASIPQSKLDFINSIVEPCLDLEKQKYVPPELLSTSLATACPLCGDSYNLLRRKTNCNNCGQVFCKNCCSTLWYLPKFGYNSSVKVCKICDGYLSISTKSREELSKISSRLLRSYLLAYGLYSPSLHLEKEDLINTILAYPVIPNRCEINYRANYSLSPDSKQFLNNSNTENSKPTSLFSALRSGNFPYSFSCNSGDKCKNNPYRYKPAQGCSSSSGPLFSGTLDELQKNVPPGYQDAVSILVKNLKSRYVDDKTNISGVMETGYEEMMRNISQTLKHGNSESFEDTKKGESNPIQGVQQSFYSYSNHNTTPSKKAANNPESGETKSASNSQPLPPEESKGGKAKKLLDESEKLHSNHDTKSSLYSDQVTYSFDTGSATKTTTESDKYNIDNSAFESSSKGKADPSSLKEHYKHDSQPSVNQFSNLYLGEKSHETSEPSTLETRTDEDDLVEITFPTPYVSNTTYSSPPKVSTSSVDDDFVNTILKGDKIPNIQELIANDINPEAISFELLKKILIEIHVDVSNVLEKQELVRKLNHLIQVVKEENEVFKNFESYEEGKSKDDEDEDKEICRICFSSVINCVLLNCGHLCCCIKCAELILSSGNPECPFCRQTIVKSLHVFRV
ncbi:hypothetical protein BB560_000721 [Smittium megazygosporum]|uniref:RING-type domain-containing protein n=1 Tax=Smittium megazygosporum TaxID=133381 RepID=A0A2T9ZJS9_9FUNG|nr:hypothetical protein BB560_000721 [Smittium megazygosporum]